MDKSVKKFDKENREFSSFEPTLEEATSYVDNKIKELRGCLIEQSAQKIVWD